MAQQLGAPPLGSTTCRQRQPDSSVNLEQTAGSGTEINPALSRVRAGDIPFGQRPARHRTTPLANRVGQQPARELEPRADRAPASQPHFVEPNSTTRTQPIAGPSRLDASKCAGRHTGDETPALSCQLTARISCVAGEPGPHRPKAHR